MDVDWIGYGLDMEMGMEMEMDIMLEETKQCDCVIL